MKGEEWSWPDISAPDLNPTVSFVTLSKQAIDSASMQSVKY